jgi:hypothetical protein
LPKTSLSRRAALAGALPAAAVIVPAAAIAAVLGATNGPDAALLALGPKLETMLAAWDAALHDYSAAERAYFDERPSKPVFDIEHHLSLRGEEQQLANLAWRWWCLADASRRWSAGRSLPCLNHVARSCRKRNPQSVVRNVFPARFLPELPLGNFPTTN